ncbi:MAG: phycobiliprotein lyase, partial [Cyanobacteria bacterium J06635_11]
ANAQLPFTQHSHFRREGSGGHPFAVTGYDRAAAEEKIWFASDNLRFRVSLIKTSDGKGVTTASLSSEVRMLSEG